MAEAAVDIVTDDAAGETTRRCLVTGAIKPKTDMLRFVVGPGSQLVPDLAGRLPGRGLWLTARRDIMEEAVAKRLFARAAKGPVVVEPGLEDRVEGLLVRRCMELLGLARRAGLAVAGFVKVKAVLAAGEAGVLVAATDGAEDGRGKLAALVPNAVLVACLDASELAAAFGREHAVHAALKPGKLADLFVVEARRLAGFRSGATVEMPLVGSQG